MSKICQQFRILLLTRIEWSRDQKLMLLTRSVRSAGNFRMRNIWKIRDSHIQRKTCIVWSLILAGTSATTIVCHLYFTETVAFYVTQTSDIGLRRKTFKIATDVEFYAQAEHLPYASVLNSIADRIRQKEIHRDILMQRVQNLCKDRCKLYSVRLTANFEVVWALLS